MMSELHTDRRIYTCKVHFSVAFKLPLQLFQDSCVFDFQGGRRVAKGRRVGAALLHFL